jgi:hypothetical protein
MSHVADERVRIWQVQGEENRWSEWVFMRLEPGYATEHLLDLHLTINFSEHHLPLLGGRVTYGLKAGDLRFDINGAEIPYQTREPKSPLSVQLFIERTISNSVQGSSKTARSAEASIDIGQNQGKGIAKLDAETQQGAEKITTDKFDHSVSQIQSKGSENSPIWSFEAKSDDPVLKGGLCRYKLGTLSVLADTCSIQATFETMRRHICITGGDGIWPDDLGRSKRAVIDLLIRNFVAKQINPFLSRIQVLYG